jgi:dinuclear metal center YbgI/SA1388 family protein
VIATLSDIIPILEAIAPPSLAEEWDNVGLQIGRAQWPINHIQVALDPTPGTVDTAIRADADLLVTHHPLLFKPLRHIDLNTPLGGIIDRAIRHRLAVYSAHTNLDRVADGLNDILAHRIGITHIQPLDSPTERGGGIQSPSEAENQGLGRIGRLPQTLTLEKLALELKKRLALDHVRIAGDPALPVQRVAICTGSGSGFLEQFLQSGAEVYITGDLRYHDAREAEAARVGLIDVGHFSSEHLMVKAVVDRLQERLAACDFNVAVSACDNERDPFIYL